MEVVSVAALCTDATAEIARQAEVRVLERGDGESGKGTALHWVLDTVRDELADMEAVTVFDADSFAAYGSLTTMTSGCAQGIHAAQGFIWPIGWDWL